MSQPPVYQYNFSRSELDEMEYDATYGSDEYDDDFQADAKGGGGRGKLLKKETSSRVYSSTHVRLKEARMLDRRQERKAGQAKQAK